MRRPLFVLLLVVGLVTTACGGRTNLLDVEHGGTSSCVAGTARCTDDGRRESCVGGGFVDDPCPTSAPFCAEDMCVACKVDDDCAAPAVPCLRAACVASACTIVPREAGSPAGVQVAHDCRTEVCDGNGARSTVADAEDVPADDGDRCTAEACDGTEPTHVATGGEGCSIVTRLSLGEKHACAVLSDGSLECWGSNVDGRLGIGDTVSQSHPVRVPSLDHVVDVATGGAHTCALRADGTVACWGNGDHGQLGDGTLTGRETPETVPGLDGVVEIAAGGSHTCARFDDGTVACWGANDSGQLGDGSAQDRAKPTPIAGLAGVRQISAGLAHTCAVTDDDRGRCWGLDDDGQLGMAGTSPLSSPPAPYLSDVAEIRAGARVTCARSTSNAISCWGASGLAGIGDDIATHDEPIGPTALATSAASALAVGTGLACARTMDGTSCWGAIGAGVMFVETLPSPKPFDAAASAKLVAAGGTSACALLATGAVLCWGNNEAGQLGDGTTASRTEPKPVVW